MNKPNILLITTGGTISMLRNTEGELYPCEETSTLLEMVPELKQLAGIDILPVANVD